MWIWILGAVAAAMLLAVICYCVARKMFSMMFRRSGVAEDMEKNLLEGIKKGRYADKADAVEKGLHFLKEAPCEMVTITSFDGLRLVGQLYLADKETNRTVIMAHGYQSSPAHDFCGAIDFYMSHGYNVLVVHHRTHGPSEGEYICFGAKERYDIRDWCRYVCERFGDDHQIVLAGVSMGATTILLAACLPDTPNVCGVIADCGFVSPISEFRHVLRTRIHLPAFPLLPIADRICRRRAGFAFQAFSTAEELQHCRVPILFAHGDKDSFVPVENTYQNYEACASRKELLIVPDAEHGLSFLQDEPLYRQTVTAFLQSL